MARARRLLPVVLLLAACAGPRSGSPTDQPYKRFEGIGPHSRPILTVTAEAQRAFDQGLAFLYAFNHDEAIRSFTEVTRLDPQAPMGFWGVAVANGPHINNAAVPPERERAGWEAAQRAVALQGRGSDVDRALIAAVAQRYANPTPADRAPLDRAYAEAMRAAWNTFPKDADVGALCAEALMDLHPWDLWTAEGKPKDGALEIVSVLEQTMRLSPSHPGALHLYIHAVEASDDPGRALAAADKLRELVPVSGHMQHMPSHIDVLLGRWDEAIQANERALAADTAYRAARPEQAFHHMYMAHNNAMLAFAAMMDGRSAQAIKAARAILPNAGDAAHDLAPAVEFSFVLLYDSLVRFGRWDELLAEPEPPQEMAVAAALRHHARGIALAALGRVPEAQKEQEAFRAAADRVPKDRVMAINPASAIFDVAEHVLAGELAWRQGDVEGAVTRLRAAIALEDKLAYMEPPEWSVPARHALGAILLTAGRVDEAEKVYREDLVRWPDNGWSLRGLGDCLGRRESRATEAAEVNKRFEKAWAQSDITITSSCLCVARG